MSRRAQSRGFRRLVASRSEQPWGSSAPFPPARSASATVASGPTWRAARRIATCQLAGAARRSAAKPSRMVASSRHGNWAEEAMETSKSSGSLFNLQGIGFLGSPPQECRWGSGSGAQWRKTRRLMLAGCGALLSRSGGASRRLPFQGPAGHRQVSAQIRAHRARRFKIFDH